MSGHSKWANIKHKKEKTDGERAKIFTKLGREIAVCVKQGGPDPASNFKLKDIIYKAKSNNMPNDNIERCIKKAAGEAGGDDYMEMVYEGYGPKGVAVIVETLSNNKNRTSGDVKHYFDKFGGNLGAIGCVSWMFKQKAVFVVEKEKFEDEDALMDIVLEAGAEDMKAEDDVFEITAEPGDFNAVEAALAEKGIETASAEITMVPDTTVHLEGKDAQKMLDLIDAFEESDDVQNVYANYEIDEDSLEG